MSEHGSRPDVSRSLDELIAIAKDDLKLTPELTEKIKDYADPQIVQMCMGHFGQMAIADISTIDDDEIKRNNIELVPRAMRLEISNSYNYRRTSGIVSRKGHERKKQFARTWNVWRSPALRIGNAGIASFAVGCGQWWNLIADVRRIERFPFGEGDEKLRDEARQGIPGAYKLIQQYLGEDSQFLGQLRQEIESRKEGLGKLWKRDPDLVLREIDSTAHENGYKWSAEARQYVEFSI